MRKVFMLLNDAIPKKDIAAYLLKTLSVANMIDHEDYEGIFEERKLKLLMDQIDPKNRDFPNLKHLRTLFLEWTDYSFLENRAYCVKIGQERFLDHILGACAADCDELVVNHNTREQNELRIHIIENDQHVDLKSVPVLPCDEVIISEWFADNREPKREFDENYLKHSRFQERYVNNRKVSPLTIDEEELEVCLKKAVGTKNEKRIYFYDKSKGLFLVFYYENTGAKYHGHEILSVDKKREEQKIDNRIIKKMIKLFKYKMS